MTWIAFHWESRVLRDRHCSPMFYRPSDAAFKALCDGGADHPADASGTAEYCMVIPKLLNRQFLGLFRSVEARLRLLDMQLTPLNGLQEQAQGRLLSMSTSVCALEGALLEHVRQKARFEAAPSRCFPKMYLEHFEKLQQAVVTDHRKRQESLDFNRSGSWSVSISRLCLTNGESPSNRMPRG